MRTRETLYILVVAGAVLVTVIFVFRLFLPPEPPIHYTHGEYAPDKSVYAPGETLIYTPTLVVKLEGRTDFLRTYWDVTRSAPARLCDGREAPQEQFSRNLPRGIVGNARGGNQVRKFVPKMPPGDYVLLSSAVKAGGGGEGYYEVAFSISEPC
jgi:hypothetical protein